MSTPYSTVFTSFLKKITDPIYAISPEDICVLDMIELLDSAIFNFEFPKVDIRDRDDFVEMFNQDLGIDEIEILANAMVLEWIERQVNDTQYFKSRLSTRDFKQFSPAEQLSSVMKLQERTEKKLKRIKVKYSYRGTGSNYNQANYDGLAGGD